MGYMNFSYRNLTYTADKDGRFIIECDFSAPDNGAECSFRYDEKNGSCEIRSSNLPAEEILPLPVEWFLYKLKEDGGLPANGSRICY